jgi:hypothetical protein
MKKITKEEAEAINTITEIAYARLAGNGYALIPNPYYQVKRSFFRKILGLLFWSQN